ncbi:hypothetical protein [Amycolatopsis roodepoortensis]|uniref:Uncharacterized protein n=1 Tax=Amycolatopsis roodepoortensis TaxID=700274 RepID=A0ABR9LAL6_9PSEU|nr:hypothetical protein [Amycolatopsis roodepoortensis]MBE1577701.1 hypothetical protein [Amycolatopsis roodepoortensis]
MTRLGNTLGRKSDLTGATVYEAADKPSLGGGRWYVLPDDTTYYQPFDGVPRPALVASTLRDMPTWTEVAG